MQSMYLAPPCGLGCLPQRFVIFTYQPLLSHLVVYMGACMSQSFPMILHIYVVPQYQLLYNCTVLGLIFVAHYIHHARGACLAVKSVKHADTSTCVCTASNAMSGALAVVFVTYSVGFSIIHFAVGNICLLSRVHSEEALLHALWHQHHCCTP